MTITAKICGLSSPETVAAAVAGGASHVGFIFFAKSPRNVSPEQAATLAAQRRDAKAVAVSVDADDAMLDEIVSAVRPDVLQLHGKESPERVTELKERHGLPVLKALAVREAADLNNARRYDAAADMLLLDAKPPKGAELPGGNGVSFDWSLVADFRIDLPVLLSGGIGEDNIEAALDLIADDRNALVGVDLSSGVERTPGVKDTGKIERLLAACRPRVA